MGPVAVGCAPASSGDTRHPGWAEQGTCSTKRVWGPWVWSWRGVGQHAGLCVPLTMTPGTLSHLAETRAVRGGPHRGAAGDLTLIFLSRSTVGTPVWCAASASLPAGSGWCQVRICFPHCGILDMLGAPGLGLVPASPHASAGLELKAGAPMSCQAPGSLPAPSTAGGSLGRRLGAPLGVPGADGMRPAGRHAASRKPRGFFQLLWGPHPGARIPPHSSVEKGRPEERAAEPCVAAGGCRLGADGGLRARKGTCAFYSAGVCGSASSRWPRGRSAAPRGIPGCRLGKWLRSSVKNNRTWGWAGVWGGNTRAPTATCSRGQAQGSQLDEAVPC